MSLVPVLAGVAVGSVAYTLNPLPQPGDESYTSRPLNHFRMVMENDSPFGSDCNYTHGTRFDYAHRFAKNPNHAFGISFTQNIYTPQTHTDGAVQGEHPYAGYMALGLAHLYTGASVGSSVEFQFGTTGKPSRAFHAQDLIHKLFKIERWKGWGYQVPAEPTFQLTARQDYRLPWFELTTPVGLQTDATFFTREELGTVSIAAESGVYFRFGQNLPEGMQQMGNHPGNFAAGLLRKPEYDPTAFSWYMMLGGTVRYVARDMFIDGGVFRSFDQTCYKRRWVAEGTIGLGLRYQGIDYYFGAVTRTPNFHGQGDDTWFGTFYLGYNW